MSNEPRFEVFPQIRRGVSLAADSGEPVEVSEPTGEYGWRFRAANGQIVATAGEGFTRAEDAERAARDFFTSLPATIEIKRVTE